MANTKEFYQTNKKRELINSDLLCLIGYFEFQGPAGARGIKGDRGEAGSAVSKRLQDQLSR